MAVADVLGVDCGAALVEMAAAVGFVTVPAIMSRCQC